MRKVTVKKDIKIYKSTVKVFVMFTHEWLVLLTSDLGDLWIYMIFSPYPDKQKLQLYDYLIKFW